MATHASHYGREPISVDAAVPTLAIDRRLGRTHVGTPLPTVLADVRDAIDAALQGPQADRWTPEIIEQTLAYAAWRHAENRAEYDTVMGANASSEPPKVACEMREDCAAPVAMIDRKGYTYCTAHGLERRFYQPCRKLRGWELRKLQRGEVLNRY